MNILPFRHLAPGLLLCVPLYSQELIHTATPNPSDSARISTVSFDRLLNTFLWEGLLHYAYNDEAFRLNLGQNVRSRLIRTEQSSVQDEYAGTVDLGLKANDAWWFRMHELSTVLSDSRALDLEKLAQHQLLIGGAYQPTNKFVAEAFGGYELNAQEDQRDRGLAYAAGLNAGELHLEEFLASIHTEWSQSLLGRRKPHTGGVRLQLHRDFGQGADDSLVVRFDTQRREFYTLADESLRRLYSVDRNILRRDAQVLDISNYLQFRVAPEALLMVSGGTLSRLIDRGYRYKNYDDPTSVVLDTRIQELQLFGSVGIRWYPADWLDAATTISYTEREERHAVHEESLMPLNLIQSQETSARRLENISRRTSLSTAVNSVLTDDDSLRFLSSVSLLQYDTPDSLNTDDRDEFLFTAGIEEVHRLSSSLILTLAADVTLSHLVYLNRLQSANNNWNRILRFSPKVVYRPSAWFRTANRAEVLANYTVYDFEEQVASVQSFSFRQALWMDSTTIRLTNKIELDFTGSLRLFERGILKWKEFKERPENYFVETTMWPQIVFRAQVRMRVGIGYRFFAQDQYHYESSDRVFDRGIQTAGPTAFVEWEGGENQRVSLEGWRESQSSDGTRTATVSNLSMRVSFLL
ncbi:MAG: hypothetical protein WBD36_05515 [Bacteroidota bacterium]